MDKPEALRLIAEKAYDVGYSAKLHFSTYDIVEKAPGWIGLVSLVVGVLSLYIDAFTAKHISAVITILGICGLYISYYSDTKSRYFEVGQTLTELFDRLKSIDAECRSAPAITPEHVEALEAVTRSFRSVCLSKHILFSSWLAHKKFFWEQQTDWIAKSRPFSLLRDKIPFSAYLALAMVLLGFAVWAFCNPGLFSITQRMCGK
ncbi:SLATT domain-containing protein [Pseudomonas sp. REP124]|uniref:SLATT domain-containing protein n=1 Tax=Pseudomonas sp. REP124 TaxID=2875731 RepID=UPI001CCDA681|nr:SLATT domain-containing protein [Pseudomonas sp. REP124]MBZ9783375.1 SLATT domain-containing protein [Pseudomonas sp. REP124]